MGPGGELRLGMGDIVISGIKHNCTVTIMNNKSVQKKKLVSTQFRRNKYKCICLGSSQAKNHS
jgi:hypothetical protein